MKQLSSNQSGSLRTIIILICSVLFVASFWQITASRQEAKIITKEGAYLSPRGEFGFTFPESWSVAPESYEEEGFYSLQLEGPKNPLLTSAFKDRYGIEITDTESVENDKNIADFLNSSVGNGYLLANFEVVSAATYSLSESRETWRSEFLKSPTTAEGVSYSKLEEIKIANNPGYRYVTTVIDNGLSINSVNYYILAPAAEFEISIFPADSEFIEEAEKIITSITVASEAEEEF